MFLPPPHISKCRSVSKISQKNLKYPDSPPKISAFKDLLWLVFSFLSNFMIKIYFHPKTFPPKRYTVQHVDGVKVRMTRRKFRDFLHDQIGISSQVIADRIFVFFNKVSKDLGREKTFQFGYCPKVPCPIFLHRFQNLILGEISTLQNS